jgi:hypothetical protein
MRRANVPDRVLNIPLQRVSFAERASAHLDADLAVVAPCPKCDPDIGLSLDEELSEESREIHSAIEQKVSTHLGRASLAELRPRWSAALRMAQSQYDPMRGTFGALGATVVRNVYQSFVQSVGRRGLAREYRDEQQRDAASENEKDLAAYLRHWTQSIHRFQVAYVTRWRVPGFTAEELADELVVRLLGRIRSGDWTPFERTGVEATFAFLDRERHAMRKRRRIVELLFTGRGQLPMLVDHRPSPESIAERTSANEHIREVIRTGEGLTRLQKEWLAGFAEDVEIFDKLNESRVAASRGRSRFAASRALRGIRAVLRSRLDPAVMADINADGGSRRARRGHGRPPRGPIMFEEDLDLALQLATPSRRWS